MERKFRKMLLTRSGEERVKMGCSMHAAARALVIASLPEKDAASVSQALFLRFYGHEFGPEQRKRILAALRKAAEDSGKSNSSKSDPATERSD
jgi:hypothetical protein